MTAAETRAAVAALDEACLALVRLGAARRRACSTEAPALESTRVATRREAARVALRGLCDHGPTRDMRELPRMYALLTVGAEDERDDARWADALAEIAELLELANGEGASACAT
jgi:hypothetical protein